MPKGNSTSKFDVYLICRNPLLINLKLQQLKKFLKERKKLLKKEYLNKVVHDEYDGLIKSNKENQPFP
tara:strand:- start:2823 stop:3026 length:204 start_codon:yes stop_codon:yes gene_type:complete